MKPDALVPTRQSLHGIAELLLAGPQYRLRGTIRLRVQPGGFGTVSEPSLRVDGDQLVHGERRVTASGISLARLAEAVGVAAGAPAGLYQGGSGAAPDDQLSLDPAAARHLAECFAIGDAALRRLDPTQEPVLWPEHFDVAIALDEVNYGVSPGDSYLAEPYAYVGPWHPRTGDFWNAPFGAARPLRELTSGEPATDTGPPNDDRPTTHDRPTNDDRPTIHDRPTNDDRPRNDGRSASTDRSAAVDRVFAFFTEGREREVRS